MIHGYIFRQKLYCTPKIQVITLITVDYFWSGFTELEFTLIKIHNNFIPSRKDFKIYYLFNGQDTVSKGDFPRVQILCFVTQNRPAERGLFSFASLSKDMRMKSRKMFFHQ